MNTEETPFGSYVEQLHDAAAAGDIARIKFAFNLLPDVNICNSRGWTALMFAARNGRTDVVRTLIKHGCDTSLINCSGQTAKDIADFWNHQEIVQLLSDNITVSHGTALPTVSGSNTLNRMAWKRDDSEWLKSLMLERSTVYILLSQLNPVVLATRQHSQSSLYNLLKVTYSQVKFLIDLDPTVIFLGVKECGLSAETELQGWFVISVGHLSEDDLGRLHPHAEVLPFLSSLVFLPKSEMGILSQAQSLLDWHNRYQFCPSCGKETKVKLAGYKRQCVDSNCISNKGIKNTCYPRTDPAVIMSVISPDGNSILLGRGRNFGPLMWSCLSGFMEPGETIEEACQREVFEETRVRVADVKYFGNQHVPLSSTLMLGCVAQAVTANIKVDREELEDACWFPRHEVLQMLTGRHPKGYMCPPRSTIAHRLLSHCLKAVSKL